MQESATVCEWEGEMKEIVRSLYKQIPNCIYNLYLSWKIVDLDKHKHISASGIAGLIAVPS
jgi:hypothetical protein